MELGYLKESNHVSFGTSADRPIFPSQTANHKFGNEMTPFTGVKDVGPGQYDNHLATAFVNQHQPISLKGYVLGARTEQRKFYSSEIRAPSPTHYQPSKQKFVKPLLNPFNMSDERFQKEKKVVGPGPGAYEHNVKRNRTVEMIHSFGGRAMTKHIHENPGTVAVQKISDKDLQKIRKKEAYLSLYWD